MVANAFTMLSFGGTGWRIINDGASALLLANEKAVKKYDLQPLVKVISMAVAGVDPAIMVFWNSGNSLDSGKMSRAVMKWMARKFMQNKFLLILKNILPKK